MLTAEAQLLLAHSIYWHTKNEAVKLFESV